MTTPMTTTDSTHECPGPGCTRRVPRSQLACSRHWFQIPPEIRSRLWSGFRQHDGVMHARALEDCLAFFQAQPSPTVSEHD